MGTGKMKFQYVSLPLGGRVNGLVAVRMRSGLPSRHPSTNFGGGGRSFVSPSTAPCSTHFLMRSISASDKRCSSANFNGCGSGNQGGIARDLVTSAICRACLLTSENVRREKGAASPLRWQVEQEWKMMGAMSRLKVTCAWRFGPCESAIASGRASKGATMPASASPAKQSSDVPTRDLIPRRRCSIPLRELHSGQGQYLTVPPGSRLRVRAL